MIAVILRATGHLSTHGFAPIDGLLLIDSVSDLVLGTIVIRGTLDAPLTRGADDSPMDGTAAQSMREQMLELLSLRKGTTLTKEMFLNHLYGGMDEPELKIIDVFICKLRKKLATAAGGKHYIETVWGRGYVLRDPSEGAQSVAA